MNRYLSTKIRGGRTNFLLSLQIINPQILGLIPQAQIRKLLRYANSQIRKYSLLIRKFPQNAARTNFN